MMAANKRSAADAGMALQLKPGSHQPGTADPDR